MNHKALKFKIHDWAMITKLKNIFAHIKLKIQTE